MWQGLLLTLDGKNALNQAQLSNKINFKSIVIGDGFKIGELTTTKNLVHQLFEITELQIEQTGNICILTVDFPKVDYDYYFREIGVVVTTNGSDKLYVYDNCGQDAQLILNSTNAQVQKRLRLSLVISNVAEITVSSQNILYVAYDEFELIEKKVETIYDEANIENSFYAVFTLTKLADETAMTTADVNAAIATVWSGESSADETAMSSVNVNAAVTTKWNGESSVDETSITATDINNILK